MALNVRVNQKAKLRIYDIAEYLEEEYSMQTARNFVQTVYKTIDKVAEHQLADAKYHCLTRCNS